MTDKNIATGDIKLQWLPIFLAKDPNPTQVKRLWLSIYTHYVPTVCPLIRKKLHLKSDQQVRHAYTEAITKLFKNRDHIIDLTRKKGCTTTTQQLDFISNYFKKVASNTVATINKKQKTDRHRFTTLDPENGRHNIRIDKDSSEGILDEERLQFVRRKVSELVAREDKEIMDLRIYHKFPYEKIAEKLGIEEPSARKRYQRAIAKTRKVLLKEAKRCLGTGIWDADMLKGIIKELQ